MIFSFVNSLGFTANQKILAKGAGGQVSLPSSLGGSGQECQDNVAGPEECC